MNNLCSNCSKALPSPEQPCPQCGNSRIYKEQLMDALSYWDIDAPAASATRQLVPIGIVTSFGILAACLSSMSLFIAGLAAGLIGYLLIK